MGPVLRRPPDWASRAGDPPAGALPGGRRPTRPPANLPVLSPALAFSWNYAALGDLTPYADYANAHMYPGGYQPSNEVAQISTAVRGVVAATKPLVTTEAGYHNAVNTTNAHLPVPEDVAGVYTPRRPARALSPRATKRVYTYELLDEFDDPAKTNPEANFGLLRRDWTPEAGVHRDEEPARPARRPGPAFTPHGAAGEGRPACPATGATC